MELSSHGEGEIPIPINSSFGGHGHGHMIHHHHHPSAVVMPHNHILTSPTSAPTPNNNNNNNNNGLDNNSASSLEIDHHHNHNYNNSNNNNSNNNNNSSSSNKKQVIKYRECLKNHAAAMGGNATDGCGEFMPSGEEGSIEALTCSACNCHRNFHRKEIEGDDHDPQHQLIHPCDAFYPPHLNNKSRKLILGHHHKTIVHAPEPLGYPTVPAAINVPSSRTGAGHHHHHMIMSYNMAAGSLPSEADEQEDGIGGGVVASRAHHHHHQLVKKRFRTKFTPEQKEKMLNFAEKVGWKIQKQEESVVQQLCQEIGIKRRVLKVWMHNNKHNLAKKTTTTTIPITTSAAAAAAT